MRRAASLLQRTTRRTSFLTLRPTANLRAPLAFSLPDSARRAPPGPLDVAALLGEPASKMPTGQVDPALKKKCDEIEAEAKEINGSKEPTIRPGYVVPAAPGTRGKFELVTPEMLHTASAHMMSFLSGTKFTSCQFYCGWCVTRATPYMLYNAFSRRWWFAECDGKLSITEAADHRVPYGWGIRGALIYIPEGGSGGTKGNLLSYFEYACRVPQIVGRIIRSPAAPLDGFSRTTS